ncbi:MAG: chitobiase/beta-hexosaminidase C-terminal domain-containing protein [Muribaculaceae bacterium]|nr:chitobiase/beta-hexosaminidase C-terminal domain-containing protein [Muribaculaceae bacterium]
MKRRFTLLIALAVSMLTLQVGAQMYIVGDVPFGDWNPAGGVQMNAQADGTYSYTTTISGQVYFVFGDHLAASSSDWVTFNNNYRYGPLVDGQEVAANEWVTTQRSAAGAYRFTGNGSDYTITFDTTNKRFKVEGDTDPVNPGTGELYILGEAQGNTWSPATGVPMSTTDGNVFTATVTFNGENSEEDANVSYFSFTSKLASSSTDWDGIKAYRMSPVADEGTNFWVTSSMLGQSISLNEPGENVDVAFRIPAGTYTITVNVGGRTCVITRENGGGPAAGKGWPAMYGGVMLQGFYWDSYKATSWTGFTDKAQELGQYFDVVWVPNSGSVDASGMAQTMGYTPVYWLKHNTCFGTEAQLREMIETFHKHNTSVMMDMVLNHKSGKSGWVDFADETMTGPVTGDTYSVKWSLADICRTDECVAAGYAASGAADEGEDFDGSRDLDHTSANVQKNVKTYQQYLMKELGYDGFRYDMCKGFAGYYVGLYNQASEPTFSVGEYWDGNVETLRWWLESTKQDDRIQSAVFDFSLKYPMNSAFGGGDWSALNDKGLAADANYQRYAVTFVDNHDTGQNDNYSCLKNNVMPANAFILAMPGTPCVFYKNYLVYTEEINNCIKARRAAGVHNQSAILTQQESNGGYILETQGTRGNLYLQLGGATANGCPYGYELVQVGDGYAMYITYGIDWQHVAKDGSILGYPVVSKPAGNYVGNVTLTVSPSKSGTTIVYTTDGSEPTATSPVLTASQSFTFDENTTLKVAVLNGDQVENVESYVYTITSEATTGVNVYVRSSMSGASMWAWTAEGSVTGTNWPGVAISSLDKVTINDVEWYCLHVDADQVSVIFNNGNYGFENQTSTINVTRDSYFIYPADLSAWNYDAADTYLDVTEKYAGAGAASYEKVYVLGNINSAGWSPSNGIEMTTTNGEKYTATINFVDPYGGYSYFSFTTALGNTWADIAGKRMGATSKDYLINEARLGIDLSVVAGENAFKIATGKYNLTLYLSQGILVVEKWTEPVTVVRGDANDDGHVTIDDVTTLIDRLLNDATPINQANADCDQNGTLSIDDVSSLIDYLLTERW